jgi:hypothetical protein
MAALFEWTRRQMSITRVYSPVLWWPALIAHIFYCAAMAASLVLTLQGYLPASIALAVQLVPGMWKGWERARLARLSLPQESHWFHRCAWAHAVLVPLATWVWLVALVSSAFLRRIQWRGRVYELTRTAQ